MLVAGLLFLGLAAITIWATIRTFSSDLPPQAAAVALIAFVLDFCLGIDLRGLRTWIRYRVAAWCTRAARRVLEGAARADERRPEVTA